MTVAKNTSMHKSIVKHHRVTPNQKCTSPTIYFDGSARKKDSACIPQTNPLLRILDDKASLAASLASANITAVIRTNSFHTLDDAVAFCDNEHEGEPQTRHVLKAATSCDSLDVTFGTKKELKQYLLQCKVDPKKLKLFSRCVIQPDITENCVRSGTDLCEWRCYVVYCNNKFRVVDRTRLCHSSKRERWNDFIKTPISIVDMPPGMTELTKQICTAFAAHMGNENPMLLGIDYVTDAATGKHMVLEVNVDDGESGAHCGANVGVRSLKRVTRGMDVSEKKYIDRESMIANFNPLD
jgi:hypothetical protein